MRLTVNNYESAVENLDFSKLPEAIRMVDDKWGQFVKFYGKSDKITEMVDNHINNLKPYLNDDKKVVLKKTKSSINSSKVKAESSKLKTQNTKAKAPSKRKTVSKKRTVKKAVRKSNEVSVMPLEVRFIKRYLGLNDKLVTEKQVSALYKAIQKASVEKTIRKSSKYSDEIMKISKDLSQTYKEMNNSCKFEIPSSLHVKLKNITDSYGVTPAIALIKRFISLYGRITKEKANRLLKSIENSKKNGKVTEIDKAYKRLNEVEGHLEKYLDSDKLIVTDIQLNGLRGIAGVKNMGK